MKFDKKVLGLAICAVLGSFSEVEAAYDRPGSLLMFPYVSVANGENTVFHITNDSDRLVRMHCMWDNGQKVHTDFELRLTSRQPIYFDAMGTVGVGVSSFPTAPDGTGRVAQIPYLRNAQVDHGVLACWAENVNGELVSKNWLSGWASVVSVGTGAKLASYNAFQFQSPQPEDAVLPGLNMDGISYGMCPKVNFSQFTPIGANSGEGPVTDVRVATMACNLDFSQDYGIGLHKIKFQRVTNLNEISFTGSYECSNGHHWFSLRPQAGPLPEDGVDFAGGNFNLSTLRTPVASYKVSMEASTECDVTLRDGIGRVIEVLRSTATPFVGLQITDTAVGQSIVNLVGKKPAPSMILK